VTAQPSPARTDGRTARSQRTRRAIVDALLALTAEGDLKASPERIVARAGVSLRTLWTSFKDLEGLYAAASDRLIQLQEEQHRPISPDAPLPDRVAAFCEQRGRMLEIVAPAARAAALRLPYSAQLRSNRAVHTARARDEIRAVFGAELAAVGGPADSAAVGGREELERALLVNTTWSAWSILRDDLGLDVTAATAVMARTVTALLLVAPPRSA
jgi:TetR/AcrR family transcriptional regulator, regulator of autoinduction and epiphytic fitness